MNSVLRLLEKKLFLIMPSPSLPPRRSNKVASNRSRSDASTNTSKASSKKHTTNNSNPTVLIIASCCLLLIAASFSYAFFTSKKITPVVSSEPSSEQKPNESALEVPRSESKFREELTEEEHAHDVDVVTLPDFQNGDNVERILKISNAIKLEMLQTISECTPESDPLDFEKRMLRYVQTMEELARRTYQISPVPIETYEKLLQTENRITSESFVKFRPKLASAESMIKSSNTTNSKKLKEIVDLTHFSMNRTSLIVRDALIEAPILSNNLEPLSQISVKLRKKCQQIGKLMENHRWRQAARFIVAFTDEIESTTRAISNITNQPEQDLPLDVATNLHSICIAGDYIILEMKTLQLRVPDTDLAQYKSRIETVTGSFRREKK